MLKQIVRVVVPLLLVVLGGCATTHDAMQRDFAAAGLGEAFKAGEYARKVDNFIMIIDASWSMDDDYAGSDKFSIARSLANQMNYAVPEGNLDAGLYTCGESRRFFVNRSRRAYGISSYSTPAFEAALATVEEVGWTGSRIDFSIRHAARDLGDAPGATAMVVISDGKCLQKGLAVAAATMIKEKYCDDICIYTVQIGDDPEGGQLLEQLTTEGVCGRSVKAADIASAGAMEAFVAEMLLVKQAVADSDGDGVPDSLDECPGTPAGTIVDDRGCAIPEPTGAEATDEGKWVFADNVLFAFDEYAIKDEFMPVLDELVKIMQDNPAMQMNIYGHTDNYGPAEYNDMLSRKRAEAVRDYLEAAGIEASRLHAEGFGLSKPVADNTTREGRSRNRRVEFEPYR